MEYLKEGGLEYLRGVGVPITQGEAQQDFVQKLCTHVSVSVVRVSVSVVRVSVKICVPK